MLYFIVAFGTPAEPVILIAGHGAHCMAFDRRSLANQRKITDLPAEELRFISEAYHSLLITTPEVSPRVWEPYLRVAEDLVWDVTDEHHPIDRVDLVLPKPPSWRPGPRMADVSVTYLERRFHSEPGNFLNRALAVRELGRERAALPFLERQVLAKPDCALGHLYLGLTLIAQGQRKRGRELLKRAFLLGPELPEVAPVLKEWKRQRRARRQRDRRGQRVAAPDLTPNDEEPTEKLRRGELTTFCPRSQPADSLD